MELLNAKGQSLNEFLAAYDENRYRRPSVTVDMAVFTAHQDKLYVMLIRRKDHPNIGMWALPGGFVNMDEDLTDAAKRELEEETGVKNAPLRQFGMFGAVERDARTRVITAAHLALVQKIEPAAGDDAADAKLFAVELSSLGENAYKMRLTSGDTTLIAGAGIGNDGLDYIVKPIKGGDLAGDHAHILFSAICALKRLPRDNAIAALGRGEGAAAALSMLDVIVAI